MYDRGVSKEFLQMRQFIEEKSEIFLGEEKAYFLESKLSKLLAESGAEGFEELYLRICRTNDSELVDSVIDAVTINETFWFRDKTPWYVLEDILLPRYIEEIRSGKRDRVRIWSAACSYGQEAYSTAMCIDSYLHRNNIRDITLDNFEITATDISGTVIQMAKLGIYDNISISRGLEDSCRDSYFRNLGRIWALEDRVKEKVCFWKLNLIKDFLPYSRYDIVFCRYVLIYFSERFKKEVVDKITSSLKTGGVLFIGSSELFDDYSRGFMAEQYKNGMYFTKKE